MEIVKFFALFLIAKSVTAEKGLVDWREQWPTRAPDLLRVVEKTGESREFDEILDAMKREFCEGQIRSFRLYVYYCVTNAKNSLKNMGNQFAMQSHGYVAQHLRKYVQLSVDMIEGIDDVDEQNERVVSRFLEEHDYCAFTAMYDWGLDADLLFDTVFSLQSIALDWDPGERRRLGVHLRDLHRRLDLLLESKGIKRLQPIALIHSYETYVPTLEVIGRKITKFSRMFCSGRWRPFVKRYSVFTATDLRDLHDGMPFVRHAFHEEICAIYVLRVVTYLRNSGNANVFGWFWFKPKDEDQRHSTLLTCWLIGIYQVIEQISNVQNQKSRITKWNCEMVLKSAEFALAKYKGDATKKKSSSSKQNSKPPNGIKLVRGKNMLSLAQLKDALKSNGFYLNVVKYYNVVADVMLSVSIKEGTKIMKGIKHVVQRDCKTHKICVHEMQELRSVLSEFKSVFDNLTLLFLDKERINVMGNPRKTVFDGRVKSVLELLDFREKRDAETKQGNCKELLKEVAGIKGNAHRCNNIHTFENYYFFQPILNIRELYHFSVRLG